MGGARRAKGGIFGPWWSCPPRFIAFAEARTPLRRPRALFPAIERSMNIIYCYESEREGGITLKISRDFLRGVPNALYTKLLKGRERTFSRGENISILEGEVLEIHIL